MTDFFHNLRHAARPLRKNSGFAALAIATLTLGIAANTVIFSVVEAVVLRPLPYKNSSQLVVVSSAKDDDIGGPRGGILYKDFQTLKADSRSFEDIAVYYRNSGWSRVTLNGNQPQSVQAAFVSSNFSSLVGISPLLGRWFTADEEKHADQVIVLSYALWVQDFGASKHALGESLSINGQRAEIIGVMPADFLLPTSDAQFWAPITTNHYWGDPAVNTINSQLNSGFYARWKAIARLKPGVTERQGRAEITTITSRLMLTDHDTNREEVKLFPVRVSLRGNTKLVLSLLSGAVILVLLIACMNVANLVLARGAARQQELALRMALGAGRGRLILQLCTESLLLALVASCLGIGLSLVGIPALVKFGPPEIPRLNQAGIDIWVLIFTLLISLFTTLLFGLIPAWKLSRRHPSETLKSATKSASASATLRKTHGVIVTAQFALSMILLVGAGLLIRTISIIENVDPGFQPQHTLTMRIATPLGMSQQQRLAILDSVLERVRALPGVSSVGGIGELFELGPSNILGLRAIEGRIPEPRERWIPLNWETASGDYFKAMGIPLLQGRYFSSQDVEGSPLVAIIDENMAHRYWPGENPVGQRIKGQDQRGQNDDWITVGGVVGNTRNHGLDHISTAHIYQPSKQSGSMTSDLVIRSTIAPISLAQSLRNAVHETASDLVISRVNTLDEQLSEQLQPRHFQTSVLGLFSCLALFLACVGIYGIMHYSVTQRIPEIGIRLALGASRGQVVAMVIRQGMNFALAGIAIGLVGAMILTPYLSSLLYGVHPSDPLTLISVIGLLTATALCASYLPARRAAKVDPMAALRYE